LGGERIFAATCRTSLVSTPKTKLAPLKLETLHEAGGQIVLQTPFAWLNWYRRLAKDWEKSIAITVAVK
jgi:hypothetical protein